MFDCCFPDSQFHCTYCTDVSRANSPSSSSSFSSGYDIPWQEERRVGHGAPLQKRFYLGSLGRNAAGSFSWWAGGHGRPRILTGRLVGNRPLLASRRAATPSGRRGKEGGGRKSIADPSGGRNCPVPSELHSRPPPSFASE